MRRQSELPADLTNKPHRVIPVDPIISPFDSGEDKAPEEDTAISHWSPEHPFASDLVPKDTPQPSPVNTPERTTVLSPECSPSRPLRTPTSTESTETPSIPLTLKHPIPHQKSISSQDSVDSDSDSTMMITTKDLVDALTTTLKNINQSPTIPLPVFKGKKGEDPEDHILKVEDYFEIHEIKKEGDKIKRVKDIIFETARKWTQTLNYTEVNKFHYNPKDENEKKASMKYLFLANLLKKVEL